jgi:hypothetical protein
MGQVRMALFVLTAGALLPALFALYDIRETWIWRGSGVLFALPMLSLPVTYPGRRRKVVGNGPPPAVFAVFVVFGSAVTLAMLGCPLLRLDELLAFGSAEAYHFDPTPSTSSRPCWLL